MKTVDGRLVTEEAHMALGGGPITGSATWGLVTPSPGFRGAHLR